MNTPSVDGLLSHWLRAREQGRDLSVEEVCRDCPELIPAVAARLDALRQMGHFLDGLGGVSARSPSPTAEIASQPADPWATQPDSSGSSLPTVPGHELLEELGRGGMGVVYKARRTALDRVVALKVVLHAEHAGSKAHARLWKEARAIARLQHPNIVQIYEVGEQEPPYFSMEFCPGGTLAQRLAEGPLPPREAAQLVRTLALAVQAAHEAHVVHRDLKPANVLFAADGTPKVADFGLAKRTDEVGQTQSGAVLGTPAYMAPEQARGKVREVSPATDVWALGAILYESLTGRPPFVADSALDTLWKVIDEEPQPPRSLQPEIPPALEWTCLRCLEKEPARRPGSASELADALDGFLQGRLHEYHRPRAPAGRGSRRRISALAAGVVFLALVVVALAFALPWRTWAQFAKALPDQTQMDQHQNEEGELATKPVALTQQQATALEAIKTGPALNKLHILMVIDNAAPAIGDICDTDKHRFLGMLLDDLPRSKVQLAVLEKEKATRASVLAHYKGLKLTHDEGALLYYSGAGSATKDGRHHFKLFNDRGATLARRDVRQAMEATGAGFVVLLTDCSSDFGSSDSKGNSPKGGPPAEADLLQVADGSPSAGIRPVKFNEKALVDLLLHHRGTVNLTAASLGEKCFCDSENGGVFTRALCDVLARTRIELGDAQDRVVSWKEIYPLIQVEVQARFARLKADNPREFRLSDKQTPTLVVD